MDLPSENTLYALLGALGGFLGGLLSKLLLLVIPGYSQLLDQAKLDRATISELQAENERLREERDGLEDALRDAADSRTAHERAHEHGHANQYQHPHPHEHDHERERDGLRGL